MSKEDFNFLDCFAIGIIIMAILMVIGVFIWFLCVSPLTQTLASVGCSVAVIIWAYRRVDYILIVKPSLNGEK